MGNWRRCEKSPFYRRMGRGNQWDQRLAAFDRLYADPVDLVIIRTIPWQEDKVEALKWRVTDVNAKTIFDDLRAGQAEVILAWTARVAAEMEGGISRRQKEALLGDLDVDFESRDQLLDAIEFFVNVSPPEATSFTQHKVPRNDNAVDGLLFHWGVGPC